MSLRLDWCSHEAAKYAVEHWHYSKTLSSAKNAYIGVWEDERFIGCLIFGIGAGNVTNGERFGLNKTGDVAELTRIALKVGHTAPVSQMMAVSIRILKKFCPNLRLLISFADPSQGHHGGVYQANGWIYAGETKPDVQYLLKGKWVHHRTATSSGSAKDLQSRPLPPKYRYLMPLDDEMRKRIAPLSKPYPKRGKQVMGDSNHHSGGVAPTATLHHSVTK